MKINASMDDLSVGDLEVLVEVGGVPLGTLLNGFSVSAMTPGIIKALVLITGRRDNPEFTLDDAAAVRFADIEWGEPVESDPTNAAGS